MVFLAEKKSLGGAEGLLHLRVKTLYKPSIALNL